MMVRSMERVSAERRSRTPRSHGRALAGARGGVRNGMNPRDAGPGRGTRPGRDRELLPAGRRHSSILLLELLGDRVLGALLQ